MNGIIKSINKEKNFGFIRNDKGKEYFFHSSGLMDADFQSLENGQPVNFEDTETSKGPRAENVYLGNE
jgi:cold shock CspA family protein